jgi:multiple antibiotic resistance protein
VDLLLTAFVTFFVVIDPIGVAATFAVLGRGLQAAERRRAALRGVVLATSMLAVFFFAGDALLRALGISVHAFTIAGGALLFLLAIDMVFARHSGLRSTTEREQAEAAHRDDISVFPLAFPLIAGPGALTTVILMSAASQELAPRAGLLVVILAVLVLTALALLLASRLARVLGETGANVITRMFGLVLAALAVQYVINGIKGAF